MQGGDDLVGEPALDVVAETSDENLAVVAVESGGNGATVSSSPAIGVSRVGGAHHRDQQWFRTTSWRVSEYME